MKRLSDLLLTVLALPVVGLVGLSCAALVRLVDGAPVIFAQQRVGREARRFTLFKLRTMRSMPGPLVTQAGDPRITRLGGWLRRSKLDELPQFWNVLLGEMSLVGPRPEIPHFAAGQARQYRAIGELRPGLSDWSSVVFRDEAELLARQAGEAGYYESVVLPRKLALARLYHRRVSPSVDLGILVATALVMVGAGGAAEWVIGRALAVRARRGLGPGGIR